MARPAVSLNIASQVGAGAPIAFSYSSARVPSKSRLVVQRQVGTARVFQTVATLKHAATGTGALPALDLGKYTFRVAAIGKRRVTWHHKVRTVTSVLAARTITVAVYGVVPLAKLLNNLDFTTGAPYIEGTYTAPTRTVDYILRASMTWGKEDVPMFAIKSHACRSIQFDYVGSPSRFDTSPPTITLKLVQTARDPAISNAMTNVIGSLDATLTPNQSWSLEYSKTGENSTDTYLNRTASCYDDHSLKFTGPS